MICIKFLPLDLEYYYVYSRSILMAAHFFIPQHLHTPLATTRDHFTLKVFDYCFIPLTYQGNCTQQVSNDYTVPPGLYPYANEAGSPSRQPSSLAYREQLLQSFSRVLVFSTPMHFLIPLWRRCPLGPTKRNGQRWLSKLHIVIFQCQVPKSSYSFYLMPHITYS